MGLVANRARLGHASTREHRQDSEPADRFDPVRRPPYLLAVVFSSRVLVTRLNQGEAMPATPASILAVGTPALLPPRILNRLGAHGWRCRRTGTLREALSVLRGGARFDVVLAAESIGDGSGYDLTRSVMASFGTLFVGIPLTEGHLWLPVVEGGRKVLGQQALSSSMLEPEMEMVASGLRENARLKQIGSRHKLRGSASNHSLGAQARRALTGTHSLHPAGR